MLEQLKKPTKLKDLTLEIPNIGITKFEIERDMNENDWQIIDEFLIKRRNNINQYTEETYFQQAAYLSVLNRQRFNDLRLGESIGHRIKGYLVKEMPDISYRRLLDQKKIVDVFAYSKLINPEFTNQLFEDNSEWKNEILSLKQLKYQAPFATEMETYASLAIIFGNSIELLRAEKLGLKHITKLPDKVSILSSQKIHAASQGILLDDSDLDINPQDWKIFRDSLHSMRKRPEYADNPKAPYYFSKHAFNLYILAAEEIRVNETEGLVVIPLKDDEFKENAQNLPTRRKF